METQTLPMGARLVNRVGGRGGYGFIRKGDQGAMGVGGRPSGKYTAQSGYKGLAGNPSANVDHVYKSLWLKQVPPKVQAFAWNLVQARLPTLANLAAKG